MSTPATAPTLDIGVETIRANTLALVDRRVIHTDRAVAVTNNVSEFTPTGVEIIDPF